MKLNAEDAEGAEDKRKFFAKHASMDGARVVLHPTSLEGCFLVDGEAAYLEYETSEGRVVMLGFLNINDRDGCHISLDMYKAQLGPVTDEVLARILGKFRGSELSPNESE